MHINDNTVDLSQYRGEVKPCLICSGITDNAKLDRLSSGVACKMCLGRGFVAICKNCNGTGKYNGKTVWDGGTHDHFSTCNPCGGTGVFPANKPVEVVAAA